MVQSVRVFTLLVLLFTYYTVPELASHLCADSIAQAVMFLAASPVHGVIGLICASGGSMLTSKYMRWSKVVRCVVRLGTHTDTRTHAYTHAHSRTLTHTHDI